MYIEVTHRSEAVEVLRSGRMLWCHDGGEGRQLNDPANWSKRAIRRLVAQYYREERYWTGQNVIRFSYWKNGE